LEVRHAIEFHRMNTTKDILVLADPSEPQLTMLEALRNTVNFVVGRSTEAFTELIPDAEIILNWSGTLSVFRELFRRCPALQWVQGGGSAGPRIGPDPIPLTALISYVRAPAREIPPYTDKVVSDKDLGDIHEFLKSLSHPAATKPPLLRR